MKKYLLLQLKRLARILPPVLLVAAVLFGCMSVAYDAIGDINNESGQQTKFKVGLVGTAGDTYMEMGLAAVESFDSTRFSVDFDQMEEKEAEKAMRQGKISAFIQFPEGFMDEAMYGNILPIKFVTSVGADSLVSMVKEELTGIGGGELLRFGDVAAEPCEHSGHGMDDAGRIGAGDSQNPFAVHGLDPNRWLRIPPIRCRHPDGGRGPGARRRRC